MLVRYSQVNSHSGTEAKSSAEVKSSCWISFSSHSATKDGVVRLSSNNASQLGGAGGVLAVGGGTNGTAIGDGADTALEIGGTFGRGAAADWVGGSSC